jgi:hypothetical protein
LRELGLAGRVRTFVLANLGRNVTPGDVAAHFDTPARTLRRTILFVDQLDRASVAEIDRKAPRKRYLNEE